MSDDEIKAEELSKKVKRFAFDFPPLSKEELSFPKNYPVLTKDNTLEFKDSAKDVLPTRNDNFREKQIRLLRELIESIKFPVPRDVEENIKKSQKYIYACISAYGSKPFFGKEDKKAKDARLEKLKTLEPYAKYIVDACTYYEGTKSSLNLKKISSQIVSKVQKLEAKNKVTFTYEMKTPFHFHFNKSLENVTARYSDECKAFLNAALDYYESVYRVTDSLKTQFKEISHRFRNKDKDDKSSDARLSAFIALAKQMRRGISLAEATYNQLLGILVDNPKLAASQSKDADQIRNEIAGYLANTGAIKNRLTQLMYENKYGLDMSVQSNDNQKNEKIKNSDTLEQLEANLNSIHRTIAQAITTCSNAKQISSANFKALKTLSEAIIEAQNNVKKRVTKSIDILNIFRSSNEITDDVLADNSDIYRTLQKNLYNVLGQCGKECEKITGDIQKLRTSITAYERAHSFREKAKHWAKIITLAALVGTGYANVMAMVNPATGEMNLQVIAK